jgi:hypothetical protein
MSSFDKLLEWFPHTATEWIEFIIVALLLWLLMVVAMYVVRAFRTVGLAI